VFGKISFILGEFVLVSYTFAKHGAGFCTCSTIFDIRTGVSMLKYGIYEGNSISKLQIVIEKNRMEIMTYKQHLFFIIISTKI
jgi:hypothetical protein